MKNFIATHEFKSAELREQYFQAFSQMSEEDISAAVNGDKAQCQMNWANGMSSMSCLLYTSPSPRDRTRSRMPSSA